MDRPQPNHGSSGPPAKRNQAGRAKSSGFDFTAQMRRLCRDITRRLEPMQHIDVERIAFSFAQCRKGTSHGLQATLTPMRFENGHRVGWENGQLYTVQRLYNQHRVEMLYILTFYLPRFMNLSFQEKLVTVFHELWHINAEFNGDIRRHPGRCYMHTESEAEYDRQMGVMARKWLALEPPVELYDFLRLDFRQLQRKFGRVHGQFIAHPRMIPVKAADGKERKIS